ncbi:MULTISPECIES: hypothetical protein [Mesorhizobium]|uniref:hypothetical protein n=1 Tax=Mesorhizobium TaxID=68287 RepID=UPI0007A94D75|nr:MULTISPECIES: hypothetical protein [Mesorhizobium]AMX93716.1 hypothetical protein A4R28_11690 [Mesorhizobium ciceri]MDF3208415.1 hypothetical protein [Mesorhizobium sp. LMG15046]MDF3229014.1 hypothetical protein [Mesorhizobium sp. DSM 30133]RUU22130.1 hypothetical protein EOC84_03200 [Mesorhizobium sp. Primo-B]RUU37960.1 hypothetical protein EOC83_17015 [Mesorhizobium sp. Primo-A]
MNYPITVWLAITVILGIAASLAIWARGFSRARGLAVLAFLLASPIAGVSLGFSLGWPVPLVDGVTLSAGDHQILAAKMLIEDGIYIFVDRGEQQPRYYKLPWSTKTADELQKAMDEKGEGGQAGITVKPFKWPWESEEGNSGEGGQPDQGKKGKGGIAGLFEFSWDTHDQQFWALPQPKALPDKPAAAPAPTYEQQI